MLAALKVRDTSTCARRRVGAVIVRNGQLVAAAANGPLDCLDPAKWPTCLREQYRVASGHRHEVCRGLHAEQYVIAKAARQGIPTFGAEMYVTTKPCSVCAKLIVQSGFARVVYMEDSSDPFTDDVLESAGVEIGHWTLELHRE